MTRQQNIGRVDHIVWIVHPDHQDAYVEKFSQLFDTRFDGPLERMDTGNRLWISWQAGLEILAPYGDGPVAQMWRKRLDEHGEGFLAMVLGVRDIEATQRRLAEAGYRTSDVIGLIGGEPWEDKLESFSEIIVEEEVLGTTIAFGEIRYAPGVIIDE